MSTREARGLSAVESEEETVARYLQQNPDFFERQQNLLARLKLPHARSGSTISLVERQVEVLREKHAALETKLNEFIGVARANDAVADRMHRFTRRLLRAASRPEALAAIEAGLRQDFDSFDSVLLLIGLEKESADERFLRVLAPNDPHLKSFESLFASGKPRCGQVRDSQRELLFGAEASSIGSVALIPLGEKTAPLGLLALGSNDRDRFHPGMSTEFLGRLGELISDALAR